METAVEELPASYTVGSIIYLTEPLRRALVTETKAWKQAFGKALANKVIKRNCFCGIKTAYLASPHDTAIHFTSTHLILPQYTLLQLKTPHFTSTHLRSFHVNTFHLISPHLILPQHTFPYFPSTYCTISYVISTHPYTLHLILPQLTSHQTPYLFLSQHTLPNFSSTHLTLPQHTFVVTLP